MDTSNLTTEQRILIAMRKVLSNVVKDATPPPGLKHPLSDTTIEDIKQCFALITAREKELHDERGTGISSRPRYADEPRKTSQVVQFVKPEDKA